MTMRIGIAIDMGSVRAVGVSGGRVLWAREYERGEESLAVTLRRATWPNGPSHSGVLKPRVIVAVGPARSQTKILCGLPAVSDSRVLTRIVRENDSKFFLRNGSALSTTGVRVIEPGSAWAAAVDAPLAREIAEACRTAGVRLQAIVTSAAALKYALPGGRAVLRDGDVRSEVVMSCGELASVRRLPSGTGSTRECDAHLVVALAKLGNGAGRFADAYGAAMFSASDPLALRTASVGAVGARSAPRWRVLAAALAFVLAPAAAMLAPGLAAGRTEARAANRLASLAGKQRAAAALARELERITVQLEELASFNASRTSAVILLSGITAALPLDAAVVAFRVDSAQGTIVVVAPRGAAVLGVLERVPGIATPEIVGPVTREALGGR
ncbi:MAG: hypothetical protein ABR543_04100 [Gemmatimonadaceae bacterium]